MYNHMCFCDPASPLLPPYLKWKWGRPSPLPEGVLPTIDIKATCLLVLRFLVHKEMGHPPPPPSGDNPPAQRMEGYNHDHPELYHKTRKEHILGEGWV